jgi:hypothetical protein
MFDWTEGTAMLDETVRTQTLPNELALQLLLGNALEVVFLVRARSAVDDADRRILRLAADQLTLSVDEHGSVRLSAASPEALDMLAAAGTVLQAGDLSSLHIQLDGLAASLRSLADGAEPVDLKDLIAGLVALRSALLARTAIRPDEVKSIVDQD